MEQYFDENKGDLKYILQEEQRREKGEPSPLPSKNKITDLYDHWKKWMSILLLSKPKKQKRIQAAVPVFIELFFNYHYHPINQLLCGSIIS